MKLYTNANGKNRTLDTGRLSPTQLAARIQRLERKYGGGLVDAFRSVSCDTADFSALRDLMEWDMLEKEKRLRKRSAVRRHAAG